MSVLWAIPPLAAAVAMVVVILGMRSAASVLDEVRDQLERLGEVRLAVGQLREERDALQAGFDRIHR
jgi:hypothetical protein